MFLVFNTRYHRRSRCGGEIQDDVVIYPSLQERQRRDQKRHYRWNKISLGDDRSLEGCLIDRLNLEHLCKIDIDWSLLLLFSKEDNIDFARELWQRHQEQVSRKAIRFARYGTKCSLRHYTGMRRRENC